MKINELAPSKLITEGEIDPNVLLSVKNVIERGKSNNVFELMVMARLLQILKDGTFYRTPNYLESNLSTSKELLDALRAMSAEDTVKVAKKLWAALMSKRAVSYADSLVYSDPTACHPCTPGLVPWANPAQGLLPWLQWFASDASE